jgi:uncharacterized protein (TIGR03086 family)
MTTTQIELWTSAAAAFDAGHRLIEEQHQSLSTPCGEYDVAALVEHAVGTQVGIGQIFGSSAGEGASWVEARTALAAALAVSGSTDGSIEHPALGNVTKERMLAIATNDLLIHTWDLARAIGLDEMLPEQNLQPAIDGVQDFPEATRTALFADPIEVGSSATLQDQLLAVAGRRP